MISAPLSDHVRDLFLYHVFKGLDGAMALAVANLFGIDFCKLEQHLYSGAKLNFCWLENKAELDEIDMSQFNFGKLNTTDSELHEGIKPKRIAFQKKWHNDQKIFLNKIEVGQTGGHINTELIELSLRGVELKVMTSFVKLGRGDLSKLLQEVTRSLALNMK